MFTFYADYTMKSSSALKTACFRLRLIKIGWLFQVRPSQSNLMLLSLGNQSKFWLILLKSDNYLLLCVNLQLNWS